MIFKTSTLVDTQQIDLCELQQESDAPAHFLLVQMNSIQYASIKMARQLNADNDVHISIFMHISNKLQS